MDELAEIFVEQQRQQGKVERPSWAELWLATAFKMSERSTCRRRATGAVIVTPSNQVLTTGYNGAPRGLPHCTDVGCLMVDGHCLRSVHAEMNAVVQAGRLGIKLLHSTLYVTDRPCLRCVPVLLQAGIGRIFYARPYDTDEQLATVEQMCQSADVALVHRPV